ncbi:MAG: hypothetical protein JST16_11760 [Bdellovibrionales bacterium]|nr:hypothetical protein [Bdellovibrionales bacterium]
MKNQPTDSLWAQSLSNQDLASARRQTRARQASAGPQRAWTPAPIPTPWLQGSQLIGIFEGRADWDEPASFPLPAHLPTAVPCVDGTNMHFERVSDRQRVEPDTLLVPALFADGEGRRVGRGRGYYDRYLAAHPQVRTVAVVHSDYVFQRLPDAWLHAGDQPVQGLLTESYFYDFQTRRPKP